MRLSQYFQKFPDGIDVKGEGDTLDEATRDTILEFHKSLWRRINRKTTEVISGNDEILKEWRELQIADFHRYQFLKEDAYRDKIFKNPDLLKLEE